MAKLSLPQIEKRLIFYAQHGYNVLLEGRHGVGKTKIIEQTFDNMGWKYYVLNAFMTRVYDHIFNQFQL